MATVRKEYQRSTNAALKTAIVFVIVSSLFVCAVGLIHCIGTNFSWVKKMDGFVVKLSLAYAVILTVTTILCVIGTKYGSLAMVVMFATLGILVISTLYGLIFEPEKNRLNAFNIIGFFIVAVIIALNFISEKKKETANGETETKNKKIFVLICLGVFVFNGCALSVYSIFQTHRPTYGGFNFIFLYLLFSILFCLVFLFGLFLFERKKKDDNERESGSVSVKDCLKLRPFLCSCAYGAVFVVAEICSLSAIAILPIVIQAPLAFAVDVIVVATADYFLYRQKLSKLQLFQMALAVLSGICFAL
ncbi:MAG: hypothetical protein IIX01_06105 [Clostridia bacterium]|nr:hypothetical protein [Clostridia bacterium]